MDCMRLQKPLLISGFGAGPAWRSNLSQLVHGMMETAVMQGHPVAGSLAWRVEGLGGGMALGVGAAGERRGGWAGGASALGVRGGRAAGGWRDRLVGWMGRREAARATFGAGEWAEPQQAAFFQQAGAASCSAAQPDPAGGAVLRAPAAAAGATQNGSQPNPSDAASSSYGWLGREAVASVAGLAELAAQLAAQ
jgi:hypothetical protein